MADQCDYRAYLCKGGWWVPSVYYCDGDAGRTILSGEVCNSEADAMRVGRRCVQELKRHAPECAFNSYSRAPSAKPGFPDYPPGVK